MKLNDVWRGFGPSRDLVSPNPFKLAEWGMTALVGGLTVALAWALAAPTGEGARPGTAIVGATPAGFAAFDPFFRLNGGGASVVTPLDLSLHGIRADRASGRGSAIIGLPDGTQNSYAVGDEIMPGVKLAAVDFDSVTIDRGGAPEKIYLDQSGDLPAAAARPAPGVMAVAPPPVPAGAASLMADLSLSPRVDGGRVTGYLIQQQGDGRALAAAGIQPGDVLTSINGVSVSDPAATTNFAEAMQAGKPVTLVVSRNGASRTVQVGGVK